MDEIWTKNGTNWTKNGQNIGQKSDKNSTKKWIKNGLIMDKNWTFFDRSINLFVH